MEQSGTGSGLADLFLLEASRRLDVLDQAVERLPTADRAGRRQRLEVIHEVAHALKGSALTVGLEDAADAATEMEQLTRLALSGDPPPLGRLAELACELRTLCMDISAEPPPRAPLPVRSVRPSGAVTRTVLCVEDDPASAALLARLLAQRPWIEVVTATGAQAGLDLAKTKPPDLVLLDLHLPDGSGGQVLTALKRNPQTAQLPVVMMSADAIDSQAEQLRTAGAAGYLSKPLDLRELLKIVDAYAAAGS